MLSLHASATMEDRFDKTSAFLEAVVESFLDRFDELFLGPDNASSMSASALADDITSILSNVRSTSSKVSQIQTTLSTLSSTIGSMDLDIDSLLGQATDLSDELAGAVIDEFFNQLSSLSRRIDRIDAGARSRITGSLEMLDLVVPTGELQARGVINDRLAAFLQTLSGFSFPNVQTFGLGAFDKLKDGFGSLGDGVENGLDLLKDGIMRFGVTLQTGLNQVGDQLRQGAVGGLNTLGNALVNMGTSLADALKDASLSIAAELRLALTEALATVSAPVTSYLTSFYDRITSRLPDFRRTVLPSIIGVGAAILGILTGAWLFNSRMKQRLNIQYREWEP